MARLPALAALAAVVVAPGLLSQKSVALPTFEFRRENVLGTSLHLSVRASDEATAQAAEGVVLAEVERLTAILSSYDAGSELRRFAASTGETAVSVDLMAVLGACDAWQERSDGAFRPTALTIAALWRAAERDGHEPSAAALAAAVERAAGPAWRLDRSGGTAARTGDAEFGLDGLAKGYVIERASSRAMAEVDGVSAVLLEIGGDLRACGRVERIVGVTDPRHPAENDAPLCRIRIRDAAVASSAGYARGFEVGGRHYSHILDPRTGRPVEAVLGATVVAPDATTADALATTLNVLSPEAGLALVARSEGAECLILARDGTAHRSPGWAALVVAETAGAPAAAAKGPFPDGFELAIDFQLGGGNQDQGAFGRRRGGGWRRPYVAVWIEDTQGHPVRTLCLWIERQRWLSDLRRWSRLHRGEQGFIDAISRATRKAGGYQLAWDGLDDDGAPVAPGRFVVYLEATREHGTYQLTKREVELGEKAFEVELEGNVEIPMAKVRYGKAGAAK